MCPNVDPVFGCCCVQGESELVGLDNLDRHLARRKLKGQLAGHAQDTVTVVAARVIC